MPYAEIDREKMLIKIIYPTNSPIKKLVEYEKELNNYPIKIIPQNTITVEQMRLLYILFAQFSEGVEWYDTKLSKDYLKAEFGQIYELGEFSISPNKKNCLTLEQATEFIQFIIETGIEHNINLYIQDKKTNVKKHIREIVPDIQRYIIKCLRERVCCVCGKRHDEYNTIDLEHYDNISSTSTTYELDDGLQGRFLTLCREHHSNIHSIPKNEFIENYHLQPVYLNEQLVYELLKIYPNHFKLFRKRLKEGYYKNVQEV